MEGKLLVPLFYKRILLSFNMKANIKHVVKNHISSMDLVKSCEHQFISEETREHQKEMIDIRRVN